MNIKRTLPLSFAGILIMAGLVIIGSCKTVAAQSNVSGRSLPRYQVDPSWPKKLPNGLVWGPVSGVNVDSQDHIWVITRPREIVKAEDKGKTAAPPVMEFDQAGNFMQGWGGDAPGYEWPKAEHGVTVDYKGNVWVAGRGKKDAQVLKFTNDGKFIMQIGHWGQSKGNADTENLNLPADVTVYPKTNEVFVADGYGNRRIIVFDADTGKFKRMWSAFGNMPTDPKPGEAVFTKDVDAVGDGPQQFSTNVHGVRVSNDGLVYVCDRRNQRVQVFTIDGKYITQVFVDRGVQPKSTATGMLFGKPRADMENEVLASPESASRTTFSPDPAQQFLFVLARRHQKIYIYDRKTLLFLGSFGGGVGDQPGQGYIIHDMATDSKGNFYTAEINENSRLQKFTFKGMSAGK